MNLSIATLSLPMIDTSTARASLPTSVYGMQSAALAAIVTHVVSVAMSKISNPARYKRRSSEKAFARCAALFAFLASFSRFPSISFGIDAASRVKVPVTTATAITAQMLSMPRFYGDAA